MSEYDQTLSEDQKKNRMHESLMLFEEICNSRWFMNSSIILFLNKNDLFKEKIQKVDLNVCFPDYDGGLDYEKGSEYIRQRYLEKNHNENKLVYCFSTCATDTDNIKKIFVSLQDNILSNTILDIGNL
ncbi:guanine nucleotide-binding protein (g protein) [Anaeramoeba flamelloides]|uniref:Guanine nucleotide-binding protein (G protein) n=1 Tax=Anaeramoeba flamelloides TaxID=1746091 RepID=A0ABQ8XHJ7_9EUKA|nr:guanine nucleotide-binding protein (g protein) [Anaeramoeba flamelloides]